MGDQSSVVERLCALLNLYGSTVSGDSSLKQERDDGSHLDDVIVAGVRLRTIARD
jgi:hypothetical protein